MARKNVIEMVPDAALEGVWCVADSHRWDEKHDPDLAPNRIRPPEHINSIIFHTTGYGKKLQKLDRLDNDVLADEKWMRFQADNLEYKPHGTIGRIGGLCQFAPGKYRQHHTGGGGKTRKGALPPGSVRKLSDQKKWVRTSTGWWLDVYPHLENPTQLPCWQPLETADGKSVVYSPNQRSIALDLLAPKPGQPYTEAQLDKLAKATAFLTVALGIVCDYEHVLDHSRASPPDRSNKRGAWDFDARFDWPGFWDRLTIERAKLGYTTVPYGSSTTSADVRPNPQPAPKPKKVVSHIRVQRLLIELNYDLGNYPPGKPGYPLGADGDWGGKSQRALDQWRHKARYTPVKTKPTMQDELSLEKGYQRRYGKAPDW